MKKFEITYKLNSEIKVDELTADYYESYKKKDNDILFEFFIDHRADPKASYFNVIKVKEITNE